MENPVRKVTCFPERQKERILSDDEARDLVEASGNSLGPVVIVALNTGMRKSEILELHWENVDFDRNFIRVKRSKNNRSRKIPMNSLVKDELMRLRRNGSDCVFTKARLFERLSCVRTSSTTACKRAGLEGVRFHDLRHTFATNLVMSGVDLVTVKEILGHSDIVMTVRYSHPSDSRKMEAVERLVAKRIVTVDANRYRIGSHNLVTIAENGRAEGRLSH